MQEQDVVLDDGYIRYRLPYNGEMYDYLLHEKKDDLSSEPSEK